MQIQSPSSTAIKWIQKHIPTATFITSTNEIILPPDATYLTATIALTSSQILKLIHDMINQLTTFATNPRHPSAPAYITPADIIHIPSANIFIIHPNKFLQIHRQTQTITLYEPPTTTPDTAKYIAPINNIPAILTPQTCYYSIGQIIATLWKQQQQPPINTAINTKVANFIAATTTYKLIWEYFVECPKV